MEIRRCDSVRNKAVLSHGCGDRGPGWRPGQIPDLLWMQTPHNQTQPIIANVDWFELIWLSSAHLGLQGLFECLPSNKWTPLQIRQRSATLPALPRPHRPHLQRFATWWRRGHFGFPIRLQLYAAVKALSVCEKNQNNPGCTGTALSSKSLCPLVYERLSVGLHFSFKVLLCQTNDNESRISFIEKRYSK